MSFPDFETLILERLHLCNLEIVSQNPTLFRSAFEVWPTKPIVAGDLPTLCVWYGRQETPITAAPGGSILVRRPYVISILVMPLDQGMDTGFKGAEPVQRSKGLLSAVRNHYLAHPMLETSSLGSLRHMKEELTFLDSGLIQKSGPGGGAYLAVDCTLSIAMQANNPKKF